MYPHLIIEIDPISSVNIGELVKFLMIGERTQLFVLTLAKFIMSLHQANMQILNMEM